MSAPHLSVPPAERIAGDSLVVTFAFRCNLACTFCMVEDVLESPYRGVSLQRFEELCRDPASALQGLRRITFSGGEVTTSKELPAFARLARTLPGVQHVRIQTNATRLRDPDYVRSLVDAGIDEFFVSFHGHDRATTEAITQRPGSFEQIVEGMRQVKAAGATLITNTALVRQNHLHLVDVVRAAAELGPASIEMWNFWPRVHEHAERFIVPVAELRGPAIAAMRECVSRGIPPVLKWFPRCLVPADLLPYHDDSQPGMLIEEEFWDREPRYGCIYAGACEDHHTRECSGLSHAYVERHGWEQDLLRPRRASAPSRPGPRAGDDFVLRNLVKDGGAQRTHAARVARWLAGFGLAFGDVLEGWTLVTVQRSRFRDAVRIELRRGPDSVAFRVQPSGRTDGRRPWAVTAIAGTGGARRSVPALQRALEAALTTSPESAPVP